VLAVEALRERTNLRQRKRQPVRGKWPTRRKRRDYGVTAEEIARRGTAEFEPSFAALKDAVGRACAQETEWEARVVAAIGAVIGFSLADEAAARALTVSAGALASEPGDDPEGRVLAHFESLLEEVAPTGMRFPISSAEGIVETAAILIRGHLLAGMTEKLAELGPELVYLTLMPYLGLEGATTWAATFTLN
jgi:hypothetical protein